MFTFAACIINIGMKPSISVHQLSKNEYARLHLVKNKEN